MVDNINNNNLNNNTNGNQKNNNVFMTPAQAARLLHVSLATLKKFIYSGKLNTLKTPGGHHRILRNDLFAMLHSKFSSESSGSLTDGSLSEVTKNLVSSLEEKYKFCRGHATKVAKISLKIAEKLEYSQKEREKLYIASLLHDIGMLGIKRSILNKPSPLSDKEYTVIKTHPALGEEITSSIEQYKELPAIIRQHHERYDGKGYPDGLKNEEITPEAKIINVADAFTCMTAKDSYKKPLTEKEALQEIEKNSGMQFDPHIVKVFLKTL
ncbi:MAG: HD domain-containing phosphohydrolase [Candidatus Omnitrophota bacterium]